MSLQETAYWLIVAAACIAGCAALALARRKVTTQRIRSIDHFRIEFHDPNVLRTEFSMSPGAQPCP